MSNNVFPKIMSFVW